MNYVEWCDTVADAIADHAERQHGRWVNVQVFAREYAVAPRVGGPVRWESVVGAAVDVIEASGIVEDSITLRLSLAQLRQLRDRYSRWLSVARVALDPFELAVLSCVRELGERQHASFADVDDVGSDDLLIAASRHCPDHPTELEDQLEVIEGLERYSLIKVRKYAGRWLCQPTYQGIARLTRYAVASDAAIDKLRTLGEGDSLDYKRVYDLSSDEKKFAFAKDMVAFANAGGVETPRVLVGVENNGEFHVPGSPEEDQRHRAALDQLTDDRLQLIVSARTAPTPTVRVVTRGDHRHGPYAVIEVNRDAANFPYRVFRIPADKQAPKADELGEVWIRKGATNSRASELEIEQLRWQAALHVSIRAGR